MKSSSSKAKGRRLQKWFVDVLTEKLGLSDIESRPMGSQGEDIIMGNESRRSFPYSIECKNQEAVNIWKAYDQAINNCGDYEPIVVLKRNKSKPLVLVDAEHFVSIHRNDEI